MPLNPHLEATGPLLLPCPAGQALGYLWVVVPCGPWPSVLQTQRTQMRAALSQLADTGRRRQGQVVAKGYEDRELGRCPLEQHCPTEA